MRYSFDAEITRRALAKMMVGAVALRAGLVQAASRQRVLMVLWRDETAVEAGFRRYVAEHELPVEIEIASLERDLSGLPAVLDRVREDPPALIYVSGTLPTLGIAGAAEAQHELAGKVPVVFTMVSRPVEAGVVQRMGPSGRNVTGVAHSPPIEPQIDAMRAYLPVSRIATIYAGGEPDAVIAVEELTAAAATVDIRVDAFRIPTDIDGAPQAEALPGLIEEIAILAPQFLYLGPDPFLGQHARLITDAAIRNGLPTFAATECMLANADALFGLVAPYEAVGRLAAQKARQVLFEGTAAGQIPVETAPHFTHVLRADVARRLGIFPTLSLIDYAEIVDGGR